MQPERRPDKVYKTLSKEEWSKQGLELETHCQRINCGNTIAFRGTHYDNTEHRNQILSKTSLAT